MTETTTPALKGAINYDASAVATFATRANAFELEATDYIVDSPDMLTEASAFLQRIKQAQKDVEAGKEAVAGPIHKAWKNSLAWFKGPADVLALAEGKIKTAILKYTDEQARIAAEAQRVADEAAALERRRLDDLRRKQEQEAREAERAAQEAQRKAQEAAAAGDAAAAAAAQAEIDQANAAAREAQEAADATALEAEVVTHAPTIVAPPMSSGVSARVTYSAKVDDLQALVKAVAEGRAPLECLQANETFLGQQARAFKKAGPLYPGVTGVATRGLSARS